MKKFFALICAATLLMTGCNSNNIQKIGMIKYENVTEKALAELYNKDAKEHHEKPTREYIFFDKINSMASALQSGQIDMMSTYESVANYIITRNREVEIEEIEPALTDIFCCAMREEDAALKEEFDTAILKITKDGTLADLVKKYIKESEGK